MALPTLQADAAALVAEKAPSLTADQQAALVDGIVALVQHHTIVPLGLPGVGRPAVGRR